VHAAVTKRLWDSAFPADWTGGGQVGWDKLQRLQEPEGRSGDAGGTTASGSDDEELDSGGDSDLDLGDNAGVRAGVRAGASAGAVTSGKHQPAANLVLDLSHTRALNCANLLCKAAFVVDHFGRLLAANKSRGFNAKGLLITRCRAHVVIYRQLLLQYMESLQSEMNQANQLQSAHHELTTSNTSDAGSCAGGSGGSNDGSGGGSGVKFKWKVYAAFSGALCEDDLGASLNGTAVENANNNGGGSGSGGSARAESRYSSNAGMVSEATVNGNLTLEDADLIISCNKLETGYDEPRLCAMYVDRPLASEAHTVQTLCRLNRTCKGKSASPKRFAVVDFVNKRAAISNAMRGFWDGHVSGGDN
jgi:hypothetical protein